MRNSISKYIMGFVVVFCTACGGGNGSNDDSEDEDVPEIIVDSSAPSGYVASIDNIIVNGTNEQDLSFSVISAEIGARYEYEVTLAGDTISASGTVSSGSFSVDGIDVSGFENGILTLSFFLEDSAGNVGDIVRDTITKETITDSVLISGTLTYDLVPHKSSGLGLDYDNTSREAIRGVIVEAIDSDDNLLNSTISDDSGAYELAVSPSTDVSIQVRARMRHAANLWDVSVTDNTNNNAMYVLSGSLVNSGLVDSSRSLHAPSGWGGAGYTSTRSAAPFAILSPIYDALIKFSAIDLNMVFPAVELRWSVNNTTNSGSYNDGDIGTSFYSNGVIYILGAADNDIDEYDRHLIIHEWGHYFEDNLSRSDSIGGSHGLGDRLDMRLAFGEGFGNALSGIVTDDPVYRDSFGFKQSISFFFDLENNTHDNPGWFSESSVQSILYDLYDSEDDGGDTLSLGLGPILQTLVDTDYKDVFWFTSIYTFIEQLSQNISDVEIVSEGIPGLVQGQSIFGSGDNGEGETNTGGLSNTLPVYIDMSASNSPFEICTNGSLGASNKLGHMIFARITFLNTGSHTLTMERISGANNVDPEFTLWRAGGLVHTALSLESNREVLTDNFGAESLILVAYEDGGRSSCFSFSIEEN